MPDWAKLGELMTSISVRGFQVTTDQYGLTGSHPIVDQGKALICGYTDAPPLPCRLPVTVFGDHTREVKFVDFPFVVGADGTKVLEPSGDQYPRYLSALIRFAADRISNLGYARHFKELREAEVPYFADPAEQRRIAAVLDTWDDAIATTERLAQTLTRRRLALSRLLFDNAPAKSVALGTIGRFEKGRGLAKADLSDSGVPCLRYAEIYTRYGDTTHELFSRASEAGARTSRQLQTGEIVFAASGETAEEIGKAVAYLGAEPAVVGGDTVILTDHAQDAAFLAHALNSEPVVRQKSAAGKGHSVVHIHAPDLAKLLIPLPPLPEQRRIAGCFAQAEDEIAGVNEQAALLRRQKRGLMQKLLTGAWRVPATGDAFVPGGPAADRLEAAE